MVSWTSCFIQQKCSIRLDRNSLLWLSSQSSQWWS